MKKKIKPDYSQVKAIIWKDFFYADEDGCATEKQSKIHAFIAVAPEDEDEKEGNEALCSGISIWNEDCRAIPFSKMVSSWWRGNTRCKKCEQLVNKIVPNLLTLERERFEWSLATFTEATEVSSLEKLKSEIKEIEANIQNDVQDPVEYADALMCLLDAAGRNGISVETVLFAYQDKLRINKARTWNKNPDNSYSHVK